MVKCLSVYECLTSLGFKLVHEHLCLFIRITFINWKQIIIAVFVDDLLTIEHNLPQIENSQWQQELDSQMKANLSAILEENSNTDIRTLWCCISKDIYRILLLTAVQNLNAEFKNQYSMLIGSRMFLYQWTKVSRPDLDY